MFAAIPNFTIFFENVRETETECLRRLNEIIKAFDMVKYFFNMSTVMYH